MRARSLSARRYSRTSGARVALGQKHSRVVHMSAPLLSRLEAAASGEAADSRVAREESSPPMLRLTAISVQDKFPSRARRRCAGLCVLGELREGVAQDARDVHLRAADAPADLGLSEVLTEAKVHDERVAF